MIAKLDDFDRYAEQAVDQLIDFVTEYRAELITIARARHITGHWVHGDGELFEYDAGRLVKEKAEEIADAIVYTARAAALQEQKRRR